MTRAGEAPAQSCAQESLLASLLRSITNLPAGVALFLVVGSCLVPSAPAQAQQGMAVLVGSVTDSSTGSPVADALVTVTSPNLQGEEIAITDETGVYRIPGLPPGLYVLRVERETFRPYAREELDLHADTTIRLNASLLPESLKAEEVVVVGRTPTVDVGSSATGLNITSEFTQRIPLIAPGGKGSAGRSFEAVAEVVPGVQNDAFGAAMYGSSSPENRYLLDGLSVNNPTLGVLGTPLSIDFIKEVSVLSGGYMPEYGRATGGVINAITKSGTNEFHGSLFTNWAPGALAGDRKTVQREGQTVMTRPSLRYMGDIGGDVGGPIIRDKLWFYAGFDWAQSKYNLQRSLHRQILGADGQPTTEYIPGTTQTYYAQQDQFQGIGKLTMAVDKQNRLTLSVNGVYPVSGGNGKYGIDPLSGQPESSSTSDGGQGSLNGQYSALAHKYQGKSTNVLLRWNSELDGKRLFLDNWLGYHQETGGRQPSDGSKIGGTAGLAGQSNFWWLANDPARDITEFEMVPGGACMPGVRPGGPEVIGCPVSDYRTGGPEFIDFQQTHRIQGRSTVTYLFEALGHHVFKAGLDFEYQRHNGVRAYSGGNSFTEYDAETLISQGYGYLTGPDELVLLNKIENDTQAVSLGGFAQDSWNIADRVTVNLGLRYDAQLLYGRDGELAMTLPQQWSPRGGIVWDPTQEGHAKLYTNYARYYEQVPLRMLDRYLSGEPLVQAYRSCDPTQPNAGVTCSQDSAALDGGGIPPNSKYYSLSGGTALVDPKLKAPSTDEFVVGGDYEILRDGRLGLMYSKRWLINTIEDMSRDEAQTFFFGNPGEGIAKDFPKAERKYDAATLYFTKMLSDGWVAQASYTLSYLRGNYGGLFRADDLQFDPHQNSDFDLRSLTVNRKGPLPGDNRHFLKLFGAKEVVLPGKYGVLTPGLSFRAYSGGPTNYLGSHPQYGPDQVYILPRGEGERLPWVYSADLRLAYGYNFGKSRGIALTVDIFNLFNFQHATSRDQRYTPATVAPVTEGGLANLTNADGTPFDTNTVNPNFGRPIAYQPPRIFRFGLKGTF